MAILFDKRTNAGKGGLLAVVAALTTRLGDTFWLGWQLFLRDYKMRHRRAWLGALWLPLPTILLAVSTSATVYQLEIGDAVASGPMPYPLFLLTGLTAFRVFADGVVGPIQMCRRTKTILRRMPLPHEAVLVASAFWMLLGLALNLILVAGTMAYYAWPPSHAFGWLPVAVASLFLMGLVIGMLLAPVSLIYLDVHYGLPVLLMVLMLLSPTFYVAAAGSALEGFISWSPLYHGIIVFREALLSLPVQGGLRLLAIAAGAGLLVSLLRLFYVRAMKIAVAHI